MASQAQCRARESPTTAHHHQHTPTSLPTLSPAPLPVISIPLRHGESCAFSSPCSPLHSTWTRLDLELDLDLRTHGRWYARQHDSDAARVASTTTSSIVPAAVVDSLPQPRRPIPRCLRRVQWMDAYMGPPARGPATSCYMGPLTAQLLTRPQSSPRATSPSNNAASGTTTARPASPKPPGGPATVMRRKAAADRAEKVSNQRPSSTRAAGAGGSSSTMLSE